MVINISVYVFLTNYKGLNHYFKVRRICKKVDNILKDMDKASKHQNEWIELNGERINTIIHCLDAIEYINSTIENDKDEEN